MRLLDNAVNAGGWTRPARTSTSACWSGSARSSVNHGELLEAGDHAGDADVTVPPPHLSLDSAVDAPLRGRRAQRGDRPELTGAHRAQTRAAQKRDHGAERLAARGRVHPRQLIAASGARDEMSSSSCSRAVEIEGGEQGKCRSQGAWIRALLPRMRMPVVRRWPAGSISTVAPEAGMPTITMVPPRRTSRQRQLHRGGGSRPRPGAQSTPRAVRQSPYRASGCSSAGPGRWACVAPERFSPFASSVGPRGRWR